jgi:hypothetical protein
MDKKKAIDALLEKLKTCNPHEVAAIMELIKEIRERE